MADTKGASEAVSVSAESWLCQGGGRTKDALVVLGAQLEVGHDDRDLGTGDDEDDEGEED